MFLWGHLPHNMNPVGKFLIQNQTENIFGYISYAIKKLNICNFWFVNFLGQSDQPNLKIKIKTKSENLFCIVADVGNCWYENIAL